ncbi:MAG: type I DNA topoisomerase [Planctomycetota bacterium]
MADRIVIVESGAKAKTISRYLGTGYAVKACKGHVRDLPKRSFGVDLENGFEPTYRILRGSRKIVSRLRKAAKQANEIYLASDPDREGEAIAWHLKHALDLPEDRIRRVTFNEITRDAVRRAFRRPRGIDRKLVDAQQARRILDRIVGYSLSPLLGRKIMRGLSAGRVQSVALRLVVEREREREAFEPREYWEIEARLHPAGGGQSFEAKLVELNEEEFELAHEEPAQKALKQLRAASYSVASVNSRKTGSKPPPPFRTSTMQRSASNRLRFSASRTMRLAQQLYEGIDIGDETAGLITYMRTDSVRVSEQALASVRDYISETYDEEYLPRKPNSFRNPRGAQAAHEAVRPTDVTRRPQDVKPYLSKSRYRLYELIWRRFVSSQMARARYLVTTAEVEAGPGRFEAKGRRTLFPGYMRVLKPAGAKKDQELPPLSEGEPLELEDLEASQHFTKPPSRYTEASLVKELEKLGIGRPSTYAPIIGKICRKKYVKKRKRAFVPTPLGRVVTRLLVQYFSREMDVKFTRRMEDRLDEIEQGERGWRSALHEFYDPFEDALERAKREMPAVGKGDAEVVDECPKCGRDLVVKYSKKGHRFVGCAGFPRCKHTRSFRR